MNEVKLKNIKWITFDFWNTLFGDTKENFQKADDIRINYVIDIASKYKKNLSYDLINEAVKYDQKIFYTVWKEKHKTLLPEQRIKLILDKLKLNISNEDTKILTKNFQNVIFKQPPKLAKNIMSTLDKLKNADIKLGIISDTGYAVGKQLKQLMDNKGILKYFDAFSFSDETGVAKPKEKAFNTILEAFNIDKPEQMLHLGDLERTDIKGALEIGVKSGIYTGFYHLNGYIFDSTMADIYINDWIELINYIDLNSQF